MAVAHEEGWRSVEVSILRMELDSLVRAMYLNRQPDRDRAELLSRATTQRNRFGVFDRVLVDFAEGLTGWARRVYDYSNAFIHLSSQHDYGARDPFQNLCYDERTALTSYLRQYHGGAVSADSMFEEVAEYVPNVFEKIATNLETELDTLERHRA